MAAEGSGVFSEVGLVVIGMSLHAIQESEMGISPAREYISQGPTLKANMTNKFSGLFRPSARKSGGHIGESR